MSPPHSRPAIEVPRRSRRSRVTNRDGRQSRPMTRAMECDRRPRYAVTTPRRPARYRRSKLASAHDLRVHHVHRAGTGQIVRPRNQAERLVDRQLRAIMGARAGAALFGSQIGLARQASKIRTKRKTRQSPRLISTFAGQGRVAHLPHSRKSPKFNLAGRFCTIGVASLCRNTRTGRAVRIVFRGFITRCATMVSEPSWRARNFRDAVTATQKRAGFSCDP
jgi:hypothetical protein